MDEIARKRGVDPLAFRLELLKGTPRAIKVVERVAQMADWGRKRDGRALGFAYLDYSGTPGRRHRRDLARPRERRRSRCTTSGARSTAASRCSPTT